MAVLEVTKDASQLSDGAVKGGKGSRFWSLHIAEKVGCIIRLNRNTHFTEHLYVLVKLRMQCFSKGLSDMSSTQEFTGYLRVWPSKLPTTPLQQSRDILVTYLKLNTISFSINYKIHVAELPTG